MFDENGGMFSKRVEITLGKGEIAGHKQFFLFPQRFQKGCTAEHRYVWERVNYGLVLNTTSADNKTVII